MVAIKGGTFAMGSNEGDADEKPVHSVTLSNFYLGKTEVTQAQWRAVMGTNPSNFKGDDLPVESVSWDDVQEFINRLNSITGKNYRLPTEAEWEYAAGGGSGNRTKWAGTNSESYLGDYEWFTNNSNSRTQPVATKRPNSLGLYDMSGNVWEWCSDWYGPYTSTSKTNPRGVSSGSNRVLRGGCWDDTAGYCRVSFRYSYTPGGRGINLGIRLASPR
jgi:formylglycine-generating enzyme required for sulfatase activity